MQKLLPLPPPHSLALIALLVVESAVAAERTVAPDSTDARAIMAAVEARDLGDRVTCRMQFDVESNTGGKRQRVVRSRSMNGAGVRKQLLLFESPADVRNVGLLTWDYDDGNKSDDQWLYLAALHKTTRISTGDRAGSFMGTDLSYSDMTRKDPSQYEYAMLNPSTRVGEEDCWIIEARPASPKEKKETGYSRTETWISKSKLVPVQSKSYLADGQRVKYTQFRNIQKLGNAWTAHEIIARLVKGDGLLSTTVIALSDVKYDQPGVVETDFTQRSLEQGL